MGRFCLRVWQAFTDHQLEIGAPQQIFRSKPEDSQLNADQTAESLEMATHSRSVQPGQGR